MESTVDPQRLIALVEARSAGEDALGLVAVASTLAAELGEAADFVLSHFVGQARSAEFSWTAIGERLGISKQAARQRFADRQLTVLDGDLEVRPRLQACLDEARAAARRDGHAEVDTQYVLLGLLHAGVG